MIKLFVNIIVLFIFNNNLKAQKTMNKEYEKINKQEAASLINKYSGELIKAYSTDAGQVYILSNGRAIVTSDYEKKAYYYYTNEKFIKDPYKEDEIIANQDFFSDFEVNRETIIKFIDSIYPTNNDYPFYQDSNTKRQSEFLNKVLLKDKNYISYRNSLIFIGEIINHINNFQWRTEKIIDIRTNKQVIVPFIYDPMKNEKVYTHYFKELLEYNTGDRKKIYL